MMLIGRLCNHLRRLKPEKILLPALVPVLSIVISLTIGNNQNTRVSEVITPENIDEYIWCLSERDIEAVLQAEMEPAILVPDSNTLWFNGDTLRVEWQGYASSLEGRSLGFNEDGVSYYLHFPTWSVLIELYKDDAFVESILGGPWSHTLDAPFQLDSHYVHWQFKGAHPCRNYYQFDVDAFQPGDDYRLRFVFVYPPIYSPGERLHTEVWSSVFTIADPWLEVTEPNALTTWRQDSLDIHIAFRNHGSFGREYPNLIDPWITLYRDGIPIDTLGTRSQRYHFTDQILTIPEMHMYKLTVLTEWGIGDGFQICLSECGIKSFSDFFSITGQTIDVILPVDTTSWSYRDNAPFEIRWVPDYGDSITVSLYMATDYNQFTRMRTLEQVEILAEDIENSGSYFVLNDIRESGWEIASYRIKVENELGEYGWSSFFSIKPYQPLL